MQKTIAIALSIILGTIFFTILAMGVSYNNKEYQLRNQIKAQDQVIEANFDKMFKTIAQTAGIATEAKEAFKEIYKPLLEGRYDGQQMMMWVQEQNPQFDQNMYARIQAIVESGRAEFFSEQKKIIALVNEHDNLRTMIPSSWFVGSRLPIVYEVISSGTTKKVMETRQENDIDIFKDK